ncbi:MAG TPA: alkaline phosphatase D family protein [Solirubrobacteraceae bacterium]|nr:alkaline phosphatase D family protein [Solirubrobacteraceae bacterium]
MRSTTRREVVAAATATALTASVPPAWGRLLSRRARVGPGRFSDGVASGEPSPTAVTLWSRLRTDRPRSGARLIVATDPGLRRVVATAVVPTGRGVDHTVKARIGGLKPYTEYFYGWESGTHSSQIGRTRTMPAPDSAVPLRIAFSSCQHYAFGHYSPHFNAAGETLDLYLFLGDYVYERARREALYPGRSDPIDANDLGSYRRKYRRYRSDLGLRELHRLHPAVHIWDDHEVENNYSDNAPAPSPLQRTAGYRAAFEWLPRLVFPRDRHRIYKKIPLGATADVFLLDERQYRTGSADGRPRHILGETQMNWLIDGLRTSTARWKLIAQQVCVTQNPFGDGPRRDMWDGYPEDRARLLGEIERAGIQNVVFLTGDAHVFMCNLLASDFESLGDGSTRTPAAVEYVGGSVTSQGIDQPETVVQAQAPWNRQYNGREHGYALLSLDQDRLVTEYRRSDLSNPRGATLPFERFTQLSGTNNIGRESLGAPPPT